MRRILLLLFLTLFCYCGKPFIESVPNKYNYTDLYNKKIDSIKRVKESNYVIYEDNFEKLSDQLLRIKEKYAIILAVHPKKVMNYNLYSYIDYWLGTPYKENSLDKKEGVDGAYLIQSLFNEVYNVTLSKKPSGMFTDQSVQIFTGRAYLKEGDLVFFRYNKELPISDVGLYLQNDRILICTSKGGLSIYDFNDSYFHTRYVASGRLKSKK